MSTKVADIIDRVATVEEWQLVHHSSNSVEPLSETVASALEGIIEGDEMTPLYHHIDPDALDGLFRPKYDGTSRDGYVSFNVAEYEFFVFSSGDILVYSPDT